MTVYTPGTDLQDTMKAISYLKHCINDTEIMDYVTFHIFFHIKHVPEKVTENVKSNKMKDFIKVFFRFKK